MRIRSLVLFVMVLAFAACGTSPRERYNAAALGFDATSLGLGLYNAAKPLPAPTWALIQSNEQLAATRLSEANAWLVANPALADVPGGPFPPLDPANIAIDLLRKQLTDLRVGGVIVVPTSPKPTTQPG